MVQRLLTTVAAQREGGCAIAVMAKAPLPGAVKTRLVPPLRSDEAAALGASFLRDVTENVALAARDATIYGYVAYAPSGSEGHVFCHITEKACTECRGVVGSERRDQPCLDRAG